MTTADDFAGHLARVRDRFAARLPARIDESEKAIDPEAADPIEAVIVAHRRLHEMCGVAPTLGFAETGTAARAAETVVRVPAKEHRLLTESERTVFVEKIATLRQIASRELQQVQPVQGATA